RRIGRRSDQVPQGGPRTLEGGHQEGRDRGPEADRQVQEVRDRRLSRIVDRLRAGWDNRPPISQRDLMRRILFAIAPLLLASGVVTGSLWAQPPAKDLPPAAMPRDAKEARPKPRAAKEVKAVLAGTPKPPEKIRPLRVVLIAGKKDHGKGEHD